MNRIIDSVKRFTTLSRDTVPALNWWPYAALRLGTFIMTYLGLISATVLLLAVMGITVGFGLVVGLIPLAVFIAIRISGAFTSPWKPKE
jgi:hypothetical protein